MLTRLEGALEGMEARYITRFDTIDDRHAETSAALLRIEADLTNTRLLVAGIQGERLAEQRTGDTASPSPRKLAVWAAILASIMSVIGGVVALLTGAHPPPPH